MKIAILGFAGQGQSAYEYWAKPGNQIAVCDMDTSLTVPDGVEFRLGEDYLKGLGEFDLLIRTPALHPREITAANPDSPDILNKVWSVTNEFFKVCPSRNIIGVTGTKGKGTTSTLIARMLEAAGKKVHLGGNIGIPPLDMLKDGIGPDDWVVLELANFQLIDLQFSPPTAVCVMVVPEHLDWHADMEEYVEAKRQLFKRQQASDVAVFNNLNEGSRQVVEVSAGRKVGYEVPPEGKSPRGKQGAYVEGANIFCRGKLVCGVKDVALLGRHNLENVAAAITAVWDPVRGDSVAVTKVIKDFTGLEYRIQFIRELDGVRYYNDSFATTPETTIACLRAFPDKPKVIILGGSDKGIPFDSLADEVVSGNVRHAVVTGDTGPAIEKLLRERGFDEITSGLTDMKSMVEAARTKAQAGDVVLLSTGCASFGLFKNYKDRGEQFTAAVQALA